MPPRPTSAIRDLGPGSESRLRADLRRSPGICVLTGGQTGVDTAAALAALSAGLPVHLVFPRGYRQEDGPITPSRRQALRGATLHELESGDFRDRTWTCVYLADVVILIDPAGGDGCQETVRAARSLSRPLLSLSDAVGPGPGSDERREGPSPADLISSFLSRNKGQVVMIAGCRASLLASQGKTSNPPGQLAAVMSAVASVRAERLR